MRLTLSKDLAPLRERAIGEIDAAAEAVRLRFVTPGAAKALAYDRKLQEAQAGVGPILEAEAAARNMTVSALAAEIIRRSNETAQALAPIEACCAAAKVAIRDASTPAAIDAAMSAAIEALSNI